MSNNKKNTRQIWSTDLNEIECMSRCEMRSLAQEAIDGLYVEGQFVKALDESGEPLFHNGQQVYRLAEYATATELTFWRKENKVN